MKKIIITIIIAIIFGAGMFFAGTKWEAKKLGAQNDKAKVAQQTNPAAQNANPASVANQTRPDTVAGEVSAKDDVSFMVKLKDGSQKKVMFSDQTTVRKMSVTKVSDLNVGEQVSVSGKNNEDGTLSAQNVSVRAAAPETQNAQ